VVKVMDKKLLDVPFQELTEADILALLVESDKLMARVYEDTINAILRAGVIQPRDLPDSARQVLESRAELRRILEERRISAHYEQCKAA